MYNYNFGNTYGHTSPTLDSDISTALNGLTGGLIVLAALLIIALIVILIILIVANCKIFAKAGEKWWKGLIPLYNSWVQIKIVNLGWWWFPIFCGLTILSTALNEDSTFIISMLLVLLAFNINFNLAKKFGKGNGFAFLCTILPVIGYPILAFGASQYDKDAKVDKNGIFSIER